MSSSQVIALRTTFISLGCLMVATLVYTLSIDGLPFRRELLTPWMGATLVDFYINIFALALWICYKERHWLAATLWVIFLVCLGSVTTCTYIVIQLFKLSAEESMHDPLYHLLLRHENKSSPEHKNSASRLITARIVFIALGCLMLTTLIYTISTYGSPFSSGVLFPWLTTTLIDFYINIVALSVWIVYKEQSWIGAIIWIALLICTGSITTCAYITLQLFQLSVLDPLYLVLINNKNRAESRYEKTLW